MPLNGSKHPFFDQKSPIRRVVVYKATNSKAIMRRRCDRLQKRCFPAKKTCFRGRIAGKAHFYTEFTSVLAQIPRFPAKKTCFGGRIAGKGHFYTEFTSFLAQIPRFPAKCFVTCIKGWLKSSQIKMERVERFALLKVC